MQTENTGYQQTDFQNRDFREQYKQEIEAIQFSLGQLHYRELNVRPTVHQSVSYLEQQYGISQDKRYLENAVLVIQAFLNLGFAYEEEEDLFDQVLTALGTERQVLFPKRYYGGRTVKLSRGSVRNMIGKWMPSQEYPMKISEVVDDIIEKVSNREMGHYYYEYHKGYKKENADRYELVISEEECFFCDMKNRLYYVFETA